MQEKQNKQKHSRIEQVYICGECGTVLIVALPYRPTCCEVELEATGWNESFI